MVEEFVSDNTNLEILCEVYFKNNNIEVIESAEKKAVTKNLLTHEEEVELAKRIKHDDIEAKNIMIKRNMSLVKYIASKYRDKGLEYEDLIQEGSIGLMKAVEKFDYTKGFAFSSYATWWIRQVIQRAIADNGRTIRIPVNTGEKIKKINLTISKLSVTLNRTPTLEEVAKELGMKVEEIKKIKRL